MYDATQTWWWRWMTDGGRIGNLSPRRPVVGPTSRVWRIRPRGAMPHERDGRHDGSVRGSSSMKPPSTLRRGRIRSRRRGGHQLTSPASSIRTGTRTDRTASASRRTAPASPSPYNSITDYCQSDRPDAYSTSSSGCATVHVPDRDVYPIGTGATTDMRRVVSTETLGNCCPSYGSGFSVLSRRAKECGTVPL